MHFVAVNDKFNTNLAIIHVTFSVYMDDKCVVAQQCHRVEPERESVSV